MRTLLFFLSGLMNGCGILWISLAFLLPIQAQVPSPSKVQAEEKLKTAEFYIQSNQFLAAQSELQRALELYRTLADSVGQRRTLISLGQVYYRQGQYREALQMLQEAERIAGDFSHRGVLLSTQGLVYLEIGEYQQALQALKLAEGMPTQDIVAQNRTRIGLGEAYRYLGSYKQALSYLQLALKAPGDRSDLGRTFRAVGGVYLELGQYSEAEDAYQQAAAIWRAVGDRLNMARTFNELGQVNRALGKPTEALDFYKQALNLMIAVGDHAGKVATLNNLGVMYLDLKQPEHALAQFQEALATSRLSEGSGRVLTLINLGSFYRQQKQYDKARANLEEALAWARKNGDQIGEMRSLSELGKAELQSGQSAKAIPVLKASLDIFEALRPGLRDDQKVALMETQRDTYRALQKALVDENQSTEALVVAERGRARAFVELLTQRLSDVTPSSASLIKPLTLSDIKATARSQRATLVAYSILYDADHQESELFIWVIQPTGEIAFRRVDLRSLKQTAPNLSLAEIAKQSKNTASTGREKTQPILTDLVVSLRSDVLDQAVPTFTALRNGYQLLIQPIADLLPPDPQARVVFIPQDALFLVPFQALQDTAGKFLIEQHTILISPAIQVLALSQLRQPSSRILKALIVGNPKPMAEPLAPLPGAESEAKAIAKLFKVQPLLGQQATKTAVLGKISEADIIHLATHGLLNDQQSLLSALALAGVTNQDGLLTAAEFVDLKLNADLAVLSACNTGRGKITGDGVMGLSRSLMAAGVSSVIVTLWSVPDLPTAELLTHFYLNWQKGEDKAQSLRQAMLQMLKENPDPRNWAGFILMGRAD